MKQTVKNPFDRPEGSTDGGSHKRPSRRPETPTEPYYGHEREHEHTYFTRFLLWWLGLMAAIAVSILVIKSISLVTLYYGIGAGAIIAGIVLCAIIAAIAAK